MLPYFRKIVNDDTNEQGWSPLMWSVSQRKADLRIVKLMYDNGCELLQRKRDDGLNALHVAASTNDVQLLDFIVSNCETDRIRSVINQKGINGWTPAHLACLMGNFDSVNYLIECGADLYERNDDKVAAIEEIVRSDHIDLLKCVYRPRRANLYEAGVYPLIHHAAGIEESRCLQLLLTLGINPNEPSNEIDQATPLHFAVV